jgi:hypothetical protein
MPNFLSLEITYQHKSAVVETRYRSSDNQETLKMSLGNESKSPAGRQQMIANSVCWIKAQVLLTTLRFEGTISFDLHTTPGGIVK